MISAKCIISSDIYLSTVENRSPQTVVISRIRCCDNPYGSCTNLISLHMDHHHKLSPQSRSAESIQCSFDKIAGHVLTRFEYFLLTLNLGYNINVICAIAFQIFYIKERWCTAKWPQQKIQPLQQNKWD